MSDFKTRLLEEQQQLEERIQKLHDFIQGEAFSGIDPVQQTLLKVQLPAMVVYHACLEERVKALG